MNLLGQSLMDMITDKRKQEFADVGNGSYSSEGADDIPAHDEIGFTMQLKKKRRTQMMRQMLHDAGYADLANMIRIKEE